MATPTPLRIFEHQLVSYRRLWRGTLFVSFAQPVLFLVAFGVGNLRSGGRLPNPNPLLARRGALAESLCDCGWRWLAGVCN